MRTSLRAGAVALAASLLLWGGAVPAQAGPPAAIPAARTPGTPDPAADQPPRIVDHGVEEVGLAAAEEPPVVDLEDLVLNYRDGMPREENTNAFRWDADSPGEVAAIITAMRTANKGEQDTREVADPVQRFDGPVALVEGRDPGGGCLFGGVAGHAELGGCGQVRAVGVGDVAFDQPDLVDVWER